MSHNYGPRIQELERDLRAELLKIGICRINFYPSGIDGNPNPRVEYKSMAGDSEGTISQRQCLELKRALERIIITNLTRIRKIDWYEVPERMCMAAEIIPIEGLNLNKEPQTQASLLNLAHQTIKGVLRRF